MPILTASQAPLPSSSMDPPEIDFFDVSEDLEQRKIFVLIKNEKKLSRFVT